MKARNYRTGGHGCIRPASVLEGTRLNADAIKGTSDAETGAAASRGSHIWFAHLSRRWTVEHGKARFSHGPFLACASEGWTQCMPICFATAGT